MMLAAFLVVFVATPGTADEDGWQLIDTRDPMNDTRSVAIFRMAEAPIESQGEYYTPKLAIRCSAGRLETFVDTGIPDGAAGTMFVVRLDEGQPFKPVPSKSTDGKAFFFPNAKKHVRMFLESWRMVIQFSPPYTSKRTVEFDLSGIDLAIEPLREECRF